MALKLKNSYSDELTIDINGANASIKIYDCNENERVEFCKLTQSDIDKIISELIETKHKLTLVDAYKDMSKDNKVFAAIGVDKFLSLFDTEQWYNTFHPTLTQAIKDKFNELTARQNPGNVPATEHAQ